MSMNGKPAWRPALSFGVALAFCGIVAGPVSAATLEFHALTSGDVASGALHTNLTNRGDDQIIDGTRTVAQANAHTEVSANDASSAARAGGESHYGNLAGTAFAQSDLGTLGTFAKASASFSAAFSDVLTIESTTLAAGTPVVVRLGGFGHFFAQSANNPGSTGTFDVNYATDQASIHLQQNIPPVVLEYADTDYMNYATQVGGQIPIAGSLDVLANAFSDGGAGNATNLMNIDASSTALFSVDVLTADASYSAESGATYLASLPAVPIPPAFPLMASALAALGLLRRKRAA